MRGGGSRRSLLINAGLGKGVLALSLAATLAAAPVVAFADQQAAADSAASAATEQQDQAATPSEEQAAPAPAQAASANKADNDVVAAPVATVDGTAYSTLDEAVAAVNASSGDVTLNLTQSVTDFKVYSFTKKVNITAADNVTVAAGFEFKAGADGSSVKGVHFTLPMESFATGKQDYRNSIKLTDVSGITVEGNDFNYPSGLLKGLEWQRNGVYVNGTSSDITIKGNTFELGLMNDTNNSGDVAQDANSNAAVNLAGTGDGNIHDVTLEKNTVTVLKRANDVTIPATVTLLVANGNSQDPSVYGIKNVTLTGNSYDGKADPDNTKASFVRISNVDTITLKTNTISNVAQGIAQSVWGNGTSSSENITLESDNTFTNVKDPYAHGNQAAFATVTTSEGTKSYTNLDDAVKAVNDNTNGNAVIYLYKSVTDHKSIEFTKPVIVCGTTGATFNGTMRLRAADSEIKAMHFVIDPDAENAYNNLIISDDANNVKVHDSSFEIKDGAKGQPNSIWVEGDVDGTVIDNNEFNLGDGVSSTVGVALTDLATAGKDITNATVSNNKVKLTGAKADGFNLFLKAYGADDSSTGHFGIDGLTVTDNTIDSEQPAGVGNGIGLSNATGVKVSSNTASNLGNALFNVTYAGKTQPVKDVLVAGNMVIDCTAVTGLVPVDKTSVTYGGVGNSYKLNAIKTNAVGKDAPRVTGMAFAGYYSDEGLTTYAKPGEPAFAKYIPAEQVTKFLGGSLRVDSKYSTSSAKMRFGYSYDLSKLGLKDGDATLDTTGGTGWTYSLSLNGRTATYRLFPEQLNYATGTEYGNVTNLVVTNIPLALYDTDITSTFTLGYTINGVHATTTLLPETRNVVQVAKAVKEDTSLSDAVRNYAGSLVQAFDEAYPSTKSAN